MTTGECPSNSNTNNQNNDDMQCVSPSGLVTEEVAIAQIMEYINQAINILRYYDSTLADVYEKLKPSIHTYEEAKTLCEAAQTVLSSKKEEMAKLANELIPLMEPPPKNADVLISRWKLMKNYPNAEQMDNLDLPPKEYWCYPLVPKQSKIQITGLPKDGKGHLVEKLGLCLSHGLDFLGFHSESCRVLYLEFDSTQNDLLERTDLKKQSLGVSGSSFHYQAHPRPMFLELEQSQQGIDGIDALRRILNYFQNAELPINVVILDPRIKLMSTDENAAFVSWTKNVESIVREFRVSVVIVHHEGKFDYGAIAKKGIGSIKYNAWFDVLMSLIARKEIPTISTRGDSLESSGRIEGGTLEFTGKIPESGKLNLIFNNADTLWELAPADLEKVRGKKNEAKQIILSMLNEEESKIKQAAMTKGIGSSTFHKAVVELIAEGRVLSVAIQKNRRRLTEPHKEE